MSRAIAWTLTALAILISCALAYLESSILASGPKAKDEAIVPALQPNQSDEEAEVEEQDATSAEIERARRFLVEQLAKKLNLPMSSIAMGTAVGESAARVRIICTVAQRSRIDRVLDDLQFPLNILEIVTVTLVDDKSKPIEVNAAGAETLGYPLSRDLVVYQALKGYCKPAADAVLQTSIDHNKMCMQSDPLDPVLVANQWLLRRTMSSKPASIDNRECELLEMVEKQNAEKDPDRANRAAQLCRIIGGTAGSIGPNGESKLSADDQAQFIRDNIHPDSLRSYFISYIYEQNKQPEKAKAALLELPELNHQIKQSLLVDLITFVVTGIALLAYVLMRRPKLFQLPDLSKTVSCPYPYGWVKPHLIALIALVFGVGGFVAETYALGSHAEESTALLAAYFQPIIRAGLDNIDEIMLLLPVMLATTWLVNKGKFVDFIHLYFKSDQYSSKQLVKIGLECFILTWTPAMLATLLSYWYHFPWQKSGTVSTELLIGSGSLTALAILFIGFALLAPLLEEMAFRGILHPALRRHFSMWRALIIGSTIFACVHFEFTPWWLVDKFLFAAVNVYAMEKTGSIVPGIINHLLTNALVTILMVAALS